MIFGESEPFDDILKLIQITQNEWSVFISEMKAGIENKAMSENNNTEKACAEVCTSYIKKVLLNSQDWENWSKYLFCTSLWTKSTTSSKILKMKPV